MIKNLTKFIWSFTRKASKIEIVSMPVSPIDNMDIWSFGFCKVNFIKIDTWKTNRKTSQNQRKWFYFKNSSDRKLKIGEERFEWILFLQKKIIEEITSPVVEIYGIKASVRSEKILKNQKKIENNAQKLRC